MRRLTPLSLTLALAAATAQPAPPNQARGGPAGVDVEAYSFALTLSDASDRIEGQATVTVRLTSDTVTVVPLNLVTAQTDGRGMTVATVTEAGAARAFSHAGDRLAVRLPAPARAGAVRTFVITYAGTPADGLIIGANRHGRPHTLR